MRSAECGMRNAEWGYGVGIAEWPSLSASFHLVSLRVCGRPQDGGGGFLWKYGVYKDVRADENSVQCCGFLGGSRLVGLRACGDWSTQNGRQECLSHVR